MASLFERLLGDGIPNERANGSLRESVEAAQYTVEDCGVTGVAVVNEGPDGEPIVVPITRLSLSEDVEDPTETRVETRRRRD